MSDNHPLVVSNTLQVFLNQHNRLPYESIDLENALYREFMEQSIVFHKYYPLTKQYNNVFLRFYPNEWNHRMKEVTFFIDCIGRLPSKVVYREQNLAIWIDNQDIILWPGHDLYQTFHSVCGFYLEQQWNEWFQKLLVFLRLTDCLPTMSNEFERPLALWLEEQVRDWHVNERRMTEQSYFRVRFSELTELFPKLFIPVTWEQSLNELERHVQNYKRLPAITSDLGIWLNKYLKQIKTMEPTDERKSKFETFQITYLELFPAHKKNKKRKVVRAASS